MFLVFQLMMSSFLVLINVFITPFALHTIRVNPDYVVPFPDVYADDIAFMNTLNKYTNIHIDDFNANLGTGLYGNAGLNYVGGMNALTFYDLKKGTVTTVSPPINGAGLAENDQAIIDEKNNIYYYFTEIYNETEEMLHSYFAPYNLSDPTHSMQLIQLPMCFADFLVGAGVAFAANHMNGDIFMWCHDAIHYLNQTDLFKLTWNDKTKTIDSTLIETYLTGDILTFSTFPTIFDTKRNALWVIESYGVNITNFTIYFNYVDVINGTVMKQIDFYNWTLITGRYSESLDKIVSLIPYAVHDSYLEINVTYADPISTELVSIIGTTDLPHIYCDFAPVYTLDDVNGVWYQLMYRNPDNTSCLSNNGTLAGDMISIDIKTGQIIDAAHMCLYGVNQLTCPLSMEYWNA